MGRRTWQRAQTRPAEIEQSSRLERCLRLAERCRRYRAKFSSELTQVDGKRDSGAHSSESEIPIVVGVVRQRALRQCSQSLIFLRPQHHQPDTVRTRLLFRMW